MSLALQTRHGVDAVRLAGLCCLLSAGACQASPPAVRDGSGVQPVQGPYAGLATCTCRATTSVCADGATAMRATGAPDGQVVDMTSCDVLQLSFTGGTLAPVSGSADLAIHISGSGGATRVEASEDGFQFTDVGFVGSHNFPELPADCEVQATGNRLLVHIDRCNLVNNVRFVRLQRDPKVGGGLKVDAVEALSYCPTGDPCAL